MWRFIRRSTGHALRCNRRLSSPANAGCMQRRWMTGWFFHLVFGKTVPDISLNAVANLGYADGRFGVPVYPGDTLRGRL